jgi:hypothetical protein
MGPAYAPCDTGSLLTDHVIYMGRPVYVVRNDASRQLQIIDASTCETTDIVEFP